MIFSSPELKAPGELIMSTLSNDISSEATGQVGPKFHLWHCGGLKIYIFMEIGSFVWLLWQIRVSTDL